MAEFRVILASEGLAAADNEHRIVFDEAEAERLAIQLTQRTGDVAVIYQFKVVGCAVPYGNSTAKYERTRPRKRR